ncbi:hypothetical protein [Pelagibius sp. Alg239-R121]|uniref:hypothetical protein n=1 Tax=Pelagibius sp. Alg239-R121 TaxID=2993448 RepID=UPI0024A6E95C|nr:hypothetical protein [Pelagibius sp. Alg239-R121]
MTTITNNPEEFVDLFVDANLGVFGKVFPKNDFALLNNNDKVSSAVSALLSAVTFPTLNIVFSAAGRLRERNRKNLKDDIRLDEMEMRVRIVPLDENGEEIIQADDEVAPVRVLGIDPFKTKAVKVIESEDGSVISPEAAGGAAFQPDLVGIASTLAKAAGGALGFPVAGEIVGGAASLLSSFGPKLGLDFGLSGEDEPKVRLPIVEKSTIASRTEFAWYLRSLAADNLRPEQNEVLLADGTHFGSAFLQLRRDVVTLRAEMELATDWRKAALPNLFQVEAIDIPVFHPPVPKTPALTNFTSVESIQLMVPTRDVQDFLGITAQEVETLIDNESLRAFGQNRATVTRASLVELIGA